MPIVLLQLLLVAGKAGYDEVYEDPPAIAGQYHWSSDHRMGITIVPSNMVVPRSTGSFTAACSMFGAKCPGRPGAPGDSGNWSVANISVTLADDLSAVFDFTSKGWGDTGVVKVNTTGGGGPPSLVWKEAGTWLPGPARIPPRPPPPPAHGFAVSVVERNVGPPGGGSVISRANGTSAYKYNFNSAYFPAPVQGGADGLAIRVQGKQPGGGGSGIVVVRRRGGGANHSDAMGFEYVSGGPEQLVLSCSSPPTASSPCKQCAPRSEYDPL